jgi:transcriptional regulator with XRE-family HTH domain
MRFLKIGKLIKKRRIEKGWSQQELAYRVGINQPDISKIEEGKKNITLITLFRICKVLGIRKIEF